MLKNSQSQSSSRSSPSSSSEDVVITTGMLGLDSSKGPEEVDYSDIDLINGLSLSADKSFEDTFNIGPGDLSSLLMSQSIAADLSSSKLNTSERELLAAIVDQDSSLAIPEFSESKDQSAIIQDEGD